MAFYFTCERCGYSVLCPIPRSLIYSLMGPLLVPLIQWIKEKIERQEEKYTAKYRDMDFLGPFAESIVERTKKMISDRADAYLYVHWVSTGGEAIRRCPRCGQDYSFNIFGNVRPL